MNNALFDQLSLTVCDCMFYRACRCGALIVARSETAGRDGHGSVILKHTDSCEGYNISYRWMADFSGCVEDLLARGEDGLELQAGVGREKVIMAWLTNCEEWSF